MLITYNITGKVRFFGRLDRDSDKETKSHEKISDDYGS